MKAKKSKQWKPRVVIPFNTGQRVHKDKKRYSRKDKHKKNLD